MIAANYSKAADLSEVFGQSLTQKRRQERQRRMTTGRIQKVVGETLMWVLVTSFIVAMLLNVGQFLWDNELRPTPKKPPLFIQSIENGQGDTIKDDKIGTTELSLRNDAGETALMVAIRRHSWRLADRLLKAGSSINSRDNWGHTALDMAKSKRDSEAFDWVTQHGGRPGD